MLTSRINFKNFKIKADNKKVKKLLFSTISKRDNLLLSLSKNYQDSFSKSIIKKYKKKLNFKIIGMGGSTLGAQTIYQFLS